MVMHANGAGGATELGYETPYAAMEQEDELQEMEAWEQPEAHPYAAPYAAPEWSGEGEAWEAPGYEGLPESYEAAYAAPSAAGEWAGEEEAWRGTPGVRARLVRGEQPPPSVVDVGRVQAQAYQVEVVHPGQDRRRSAPAPRKRPFVRREEGRLDADSRGVSYDK